MSSLVVGGVPIKVAVSSPRWTRMDAVDRARAFDNTFRASQTGGAVRVWDFETPAVLAATEGETYKAALSTVASQLCSGDIIAIPTMCSAELTDGVPTSVAGDPYVVLSFSLHEVQPAKVLLRYSPGDTITGESFTRSTTAYQLNGNIANPLTLVGINAKRDTHYINSVRSILLEAARTNSMLHANDFSNAAWTKSSCTVGTGIADPTGGTTACTLTATAINGLVQQHLTDGASLVRSNSIWIRRRTGTGVVNLYDPLGGNPLACALTANWQRFQRTGGASVLRDLVVLLATSGDAIDVWCGQQEDGAFASSEIPTTTVAVTRGADSYSVPFTMPPQEMTVYAKFVEKGTALLSSHIWSITNAASASPIFMGLTSGSLYFANHINAANVSSSRPVSALEAVNELVFRLFGDGSVDIAQSINGAAVTTGTQSAATPLAAAWADDILWLNATGSSVTGFTAIQSFKIIAGSRSLAELRTL